MNNTRIPILGLLALFAFACDSGKKTAGGSPGETTNGIRFSLSDVDGLPATSARVYLYDLFTMKKVDSTQSDSAGYFVFDTIRLSTFGLELINQDSSQMTWIAGITPERANSLRLSLSATALVELSAPGDNSNSAFQLAGTPYRAPANGDTIRFRVPQGNYAVTLDARFVGFLDARQSAVASLIIVLPEPDPGAQPDPGIPIENFDDGDRRPLYESYWPDDSWIWWLGFDSTFGGIHPSKTPNIVNAIYEEGAYRGKSLRIQYYSIVQWIGFRFAQSTDFRELDSISIAVKGDGDVIIALEHVRNPALEADSLELDEPYYKTTWRVSATKEWSRAVFHMDSTADTLLSNMPWNSIHDRIDQVTLFFHNGSDIFIDDLIFYGLPIERFTTAPLSAD